jgi:hypothetical protein
LVGEAPRKKSVKTQIQKSQPALIETKRASPFAPQTATRTALRAALRTAPLIPLCSLPSPPVHLAEEGGKGKSSVGGGAIDQVQGMEDLIQATSLLAVSSEGKTGEMRLLKCCADCGTRGKFKFSKNQWRGGPASNNRKCKECMTKQQKKKQQYRNARVAK